MHLPCHLHSTPLLAATRQAQAGFQPRPCILGAVVPAGAHASVVLKDAINVDAAGKLCLARAVAELPATVGRAPYCNPRAPVLTKPGYFTRPSLKRLQRMRSRQLQACHPFSPGILTSPPPMSKQHDRRSARQLGADRGSRMQAVEGFVVGERGVGEAAFIGAVNVLGLDLDSIVHFGRGRVQVYGLLQGPRRPPSGEGLNVPALLTFRCALLSDTSSVGP